MPLGSRTRIDGGAYLGAGEAKDGQVRRARLRPHRPDACPQHQGPPARRAGLGLRRGGAGGGREAAAELGADVAASVDEALDDGEVDAVFIASSTDTHVDLITRAAKAGKAVLCEKPIDLDIARVDACWAEIGTLDPLVMIGFNRRFDPSFKALRDRHPGWRDRPAGAGGHHQPRSGAAAGRVPEGLRRPVPRHDHPRLRHGALSGRRHRRGAGDGGQPDRPGHQGDRRHRRRDDRPARRVRRPGPHQQQPTMRLRLRPAGRSLRREGHAAGPQPAPDHGRRLGRRAHRRP